MPKKKIPNTPCPAMENVDFDYHLSGDCLKFCICALTKKKCIGIDRHDPDNASSQFFSRAKNAVVESKIETCPCYGMSNEMFVALMKDKSDRAIAAFERRVNGE